MVTFSSNGLAKSLEIEQLSGARMSCLPMPLDCRLEGKLKEILLMNLSSEFVSEGRR